MHTEMNNGIHHLKGSKVLVLGGAGFIGSHLVRALLAQPIEELVVYDNFSRGKKENILDCLEDPRCQIFPYGGDIRDIDLLDKAMEGKDYVFHLAAMWLLHCRDFPRTAFEVNIAGTFNVLEACVRHKIKKLIFSSSASVYGDAQSVPMTEDHPFRNRNFYGATKISGEAMCTAYHERYGLPVVGLRYMNVYGPGQDQHAVYSGVVPILLNHIDARTSPVIHGDGSQAYDFIYVKDVAEANLCALQSPVQHGFYNVGTGVQTSVRTLCQKILELKGAHIPIKFQPYGPEDARALVKNRIGSTDKAASELGFRYAYELEQGLRELIQWREEIGF